MHGKIDKEAMRYKTETIQVVNVMLKLMTENAYCEKAKRLVPRTDSFWLCQSCFFFCCHYARCVIQDAYALVTVGITARRVVRVSRSLHGLRRTSSRFVLGTSVILEVGEDGSSMRRGDGRTAGILVVSLRVGAAGLVSRLGGAISGNGLPSRNGLIEGIVVLKHGIQARSGSRHAAAVVGAQAAGGTVAGSDASIAGIVVTAAGTDGGKSGTAVIVKRVILEAIVERAVRLVVAGGSLAIAGNQVRSAVVGRGDIGLAISIGPVVVAVAVVIGG